MTQTTFTTISRANAFMWQAERDSSTFFNRRMRTTTSFCPRYHRHWAPVQPRILAKEGRARTVSTWRFQRVRAAAQKCGFIPYRIKDRRSDQNAGRKKPVSQPHGGGRSEGAP